MAPPSCASIRAIARPTSDIVTKEAWADVNAANEIDARTASTPTTLPVRGMPQPDRSRSP
jgi:hypothetical protein